MAEVLFKDLSYQIIGCAFRVHSMYGSGHKESLYQEAFADELASANLKYSREELIKIYNPETGKRLRSSYRPDFVVEGKVIIEIKAIPKMAKFFTDQLYDYLRNSDYELGYLVNFAESSLRPLRIIYTNDRKNH